MSRKTDRTAKAARRAAANAMALTAPAGVDALSSPGIAAQMRWRRRTGFNPLVTLSSLSLTRALEAFERGELAEAALLWDAMARRDDIIPSVKAKREKAIADKKLEVTPLDRSAEAEAHKATLETFWRNVRWVDAWERANQGGAQKLVRAMQRAVSFRYQVHHIVWRPTRDGLRATFEAVPLWFFENRQARLRFLPNGMGQDGMDLDEENWLVSCGDGLMVAGSIGYYLKRATLQDWLRFSEKFSVPPVVGRTSAQSGTPEGLAMAEAVEAFGNDMAAVIYGDDGSSKIELIQANGSPQGMPMPALIERVDRRLAAMWRGADLSTMSAGMAQEGSGASVQSDEKELLERADAADRSEELQQIDRRVIAWTYGAGVEPLAQTEIIVPRPEDARLTLEAAKVFIDLGARLGKADLLNRFGLSEAGDGEAAFEGGNGGNGGDFGDGMGRDPQKGGVHGRAFGPGSRGTADEGQDSGEEAAARLRGNGGDFGDGDGGPTENAERTEGANAVGVDAGGTTEGTEVAEGDPLLAAMSELVRLARIEDQAALRDELRRVLTLPDRMEVREALLRLRDRLPDWVGETTNQEDAWQRVMAAAVADGLVADGEIGANAYDPTQPRVPRGNPIGGEWTDDPRWVAAQGPAKEASRKGDDGADDDGKISVKATDIQMGDLMPSRSIYTKEVGFFPVTKVRVLDERWKQYQGWIEVTMKDAGVMKFDPKRWPTVRLKRPGQSGR